MHRNIASSTVISRLALFKTNSEHKVTNQVQSSKSPNVLLTILLLQVIELRKILFDEGVLEEGSSHDTGLVPVAVYRDGRYRSLASGSVISSQ